MLGSLLSLIILVILFGINLFDLRLDGTVGTSVLCDLKPSKLAWSRGYEEGLGVELENGSEHDGKLV